MSAFGAVGTALVLVAATCVAQIARADAVATQLDLEQLAPPGACAEEVPRGEPSVDERFDVAGGPREHFDPRDVAGGGPGPVFDPPDAPSVEPGSCEGPAAAGCEIAVRRSGVVSEPKPGSGGGNPFPGAGGLP